MADYTLTLAAARSIVTADGAGPLSITIAAVKPASCLVLATVSERRRTVKVQRGAISATNGDSTPKNAAITAVGALGQAFVTSSIRAVRTAVGAAGATVKLSAADQVRLEWLGGALGVGEDIVAEYEVVEPILRRAGARVYLIDATHLGIAWDGGTLEADEQIDVRYQVVDLESFGDDFKEILFRQQRTLGFLGEFMLQDLPTTDDAGNPATYRLRIFDTQAHMDAATVNIAAASPLETGELSRVNVTAAYSFPRGDVTSRTFKREDVAATPGVN